MNNLSLMQRNLRSKFLCMKLWAERYNIHSFPDKLKSLQNNNPCYVQINKDFQELYKFSKHPTYLYFFYGKLPVYSKKE